MKKIKWIFSSLCFTRLVKISSTKNIPRRKGRETSSPAQRPQAKVAESVTISVAAAGVGTGAGLVALRDVTQVDKFKHMGVAGAATVALGLMGVSPALAAGTVFIGASLGKELVFDHLMGRGQASLFDTSANLAGALAGFALLKLGQASFSSTQSHSSYLGAPAPLVSDDAKRPLPSLRDPNLQNDSGEG